MLTERELPQRKLVRVPDVVGLPLRKALLLVEQAGLRSAGVLYKESYEEKDTVLEQKPQRGQMVYVSEDVTLWVSRESYIKWLPAIYQRSDATGRNVVRDLLWIIQHLFGLIESQLDNLHLYFDSYETPERFLPWLASWSAMLLEADWPTSKKRRLIKKAMELYRLRGTVKGLKLFIALFTGFEPYLHENEWPFQGFRIGTSSTVGIDTVILPPVDKSHAFVCVMPHQFKDVTKESIIRLHEIIEMEKPAHSSYMLKFEEPRQAVEEREFYRIGVASGINIGEEIVTPLPIDEAGEPELPQEPQMPEPAPDPSVYELFGTKKRQLPPILSAPRADSAPVEGKEVTSSKYGFEGAREFRIDDIMRELLERAGVTVETGESGAIVPKAPEPEPEPPPREKTEAEKIAEEIGDLLAQKAAAVPAGHQAPGRGPRIELDVDVKEVDAPAGSDPDAAPKVSASLESDKGGSGGGEVVTAAKRTGGLTSEWTALADSAQTPVDELEEADPEVLSEEDDGAARVRNTGVPAGHQPPGRSGHIDVDVEVKEVERDETPADLATATAAATDAGTGIGNGSASGTDDAANWLTIASPMEITPEEIASAGKKNEEKQRAVKESDEKAPETPQDGRKAGEDAPGDARTGAAGTDAATAGQGDTGERPGKPGTDGEKN